MERISATLCSVAIYVANGCTTYLQLDSAFSGYIGVTRRAGYRNENNVLVVNHRTVSLNFLPYVIDFALHCQCTCNRPNFRHRQYHPSALHRTGHNRSQSQSRLQHQSVTVGRATATQCPTLHTTARDRL